GNTTWRNDNNRTAPNARPAAAPQAYGASGMGKLRNPLKEPRASLITFIVRDDSSNADVVMQTSDPSWTTYNTFDVGNAYGGDTTSTGRPRSGRTWKPRGTRVSTWHS